MSGGGDYHAIVLAAGAGSRFGGSKLTAKWQDGVLLDGALRSARAAPVNSVVVVLGAHSAEVGKVVAISGSLPGAPILAVYCADHGLGMAASLRQGLLALPQDAAGAFIFLGDMPGIGSAISTRLLASLSETHLAAVPSNAGRLGHPVLIRRDLFDDFADAAGDGRGRTILHDLGGSLARLDVDDEGIFIDIDTPGDFARSHTHKP